MNKYSRIITVFLVCSIEPQMSDERGFRKMEREDMKDEEDKGGNDKLAKVYNEPRQGQM